MGLGGSHPLLLVEAAHHKLYSAWQTWAHIHDPQGVLSVQNEGCRGCCCNMSTAEGATCVSCYSLLSRAHDSKGFTKKRERKTGIEEIIVVPTKGSYGGVL